ncbi:FAD-dependent oxidoreductase [Mucilaginibacter terrae]|uniref:Glycine/D-amino acid oxidase-like deaminating enzyme/nitrite reductase/ring-hydroxylating ferredoxin subunit n=1 Tax=Mucilaginibacter terrae TaxID=1955052 RepID=A0ABU3GTD6_9SPHI|nr:FAD-dependent oxidoreductase [Mucilaginibacter terrae]MDT3402232.1 glycine/D-amino acid oxidase-like deaminating enzyme/nitrite reductase/ring-hydroxylating ferredoxin subunit [Mucilaginibacter terrae]
MKNVVSKLNRDGKQVSPWQHTSKIPVIHHHENMVYDCLIVGAGITGITAALKLQLAGKTTLVAEAFTIGYGTTGGTSAHINTFADTTYTEAESAFGKEGARQFAHAVNEGLNLIRKNVEEYRIDCDFKILPGYLYAEDEEQVKQLDDIYKGAVSVEVPVEYVSDVPTNVPYQKALKFDGQAQFEPIKYLHRLAQEYLKAGGIILQYTKIDEVESGDGVHVAKTGQTSIKAKSIIYATHMPPGINVLNMRCAPYRSYVFGVKLKDDKYPDALVYDLQEPYHYVRTHVINGQKLLIIGGNDHKTGHDDEEAAFADLEEYTRQYYNVDVVKYRWSSQYYVPVDGLPYVGEMPDRADGIYCATGFNGNGMMLGSVSGAILADLILGNANPLSQLFSIKRFKPIDGFTEFVKENADVAWHFVADRFKAEEIKALNDVETGVGKIIELDGKKVAAYRDEQGELHTLSSVCTHMGCTVKWNTTEKSWDCPCHGARFDIDGNVVTGPATVNLEKVNV